MKKGYAGGKKKENVFAMRRTTSNREFSTNSFACAFNPLSLLQFLLKSFFIKGEIQIFFTNMIFLTRTIASSLEIFVFFEKRRLAFRDIRGVSRANFREQGLTSASRYTPGR